jgi:hypothetical protein
MFADEPALTLRAIVRGAPTATLSIELLRWSTDSERTTLLTALSAPPPAAPAAAAGARGGRAGRGGRGGRGAGPPATPVSRLTAAIKAAPTVGFIWADGPTGYAIKYAWRTALPDGRERVVLATDRRLGAHSTAWPAPSPSADDLEFTVIELRLDGAGVPSTSSGTTRVPSRVDPSTGSGSPPAAMTGEGKASLHSTVVVDAAASTLALEDDYSSPFMFTVTR